MNVAISVVGIGKGLKLGLGALVPAMPILFSGRREDRTRQGVARAERIALEETALSLLERFLATAGAKPLDGEHRAATLTRLEACLAGLAASPRSAASRAWLRKLDGARAALAGAVRREALLSAPPRRLAR